MLSLFKTKPLLDTDTRNWLLEGFSWCLEQLGTQEFFEQSILVLPTNECFPGRIDSIDGMASLIFDKVKTYSGIAHWPTQTVDYRLLDGMSLPDIEIHGALRGPQSMLEESTDDQARLIFPYNPEQVARPENLIASFAHQVAHYLAQSSEEPPPGGNNFWPQITELTAIYLGFGIMFANSAFTFRGGCGSCYNPNAVRDVYLSEFEATYALAIFCCLKQIDLKQATPHLKKHLRSYFKKSVDEITANQAYLDKLSNL